MARTSPIEDRLLEALGPVLAENGMSLVMCHTHKPQALHSPECLVLAPPTHTKGQPAVLICRQAAVIGYELDFLLRLFNIGKPGDIDAAMAIECDGHDAHERTKEQASHDRARDRALLIKRGLVTIRFTGADIHRDANQCALEAIDALISIGAIKGRP